MGEICRREGYPENQTGEEGLGRGEAGLGRPVGLERKEQGKRRAVAIGSASECRCVDMQAMNFDQTNADVFLSSRCGSQPVSGCSR